MKIGRVIHGPDDNPSKPCRLIVATSDSQHHIFPTASEVAGREIAGSWVRFTPCTLTGAVLRWQWLPEPNPDGSWSGTVYKASYLSCGEMNLTIVAPDVKTAFVARVHPDAVMGDLARRLSREALSRLATRMKGTAVAFWPREDDAFLVGDIMLNPRQWPEREEPPRLRLVA